MGCLLLSAQYEMNAAAFQVIAESGFYNGSKISTATKEMPKLLGVFVLNMNTVLFLTEVIQIEVILLSNYSNQTAPSQL